MSIRVMTAVFDYSEAAGNDRLILLVIADRSNDDGTGCWRGRESIARMARVDTRTVSRSIQRLEALGELVVDRRPGTTSEYRIVLPGVGTDCPDQVGTESPGGLDTSVKGVGTPVSRDTSLDVPYPRAGATILSRGVDAAPLWELDDHGNARPTTTPPDGPTNGRPPGSRRSKGRTREGSER